MVDDDPSEDRLLELVKELEELDVAFFPLLETSPPTQVELFWINSPIEYQFLAITHDDNRDHNKVIINGPFSGDEFLDELEEILSKPRWRQPVDEQVFPRFDHSIGTTLDVSTRRDVAIDTFQGIESQLGLEIFQSDLTSVKAVQRLDDDNWLFFIRGNLFGIDSVDELVSIFIEEQPSEEDDGQDDEQEDEEEEDYLFSEQKDALGTYIYEPVWVEGIPDLNFKDRVLIDPPLEYDTVYSTKFGSYTVVITKDGFVGVDEPNNKSVVLDILNTIFGTSILLEHPFQAATRDDLLEIVIEKDGNISERTGSPSTRRLHATPEPWIASNRHHMMMSSPVERKLIEGEYFNDLCDKSEEIFKNEHMKERISSTLQAYTHHVNGEYTQAFLLAWISIEQYINTRIDEYLKENKGVNSDRRRNMQRGGHWSASHLIELMEVSGCITNSRYEKVTDMRKRRNEIVHETDSATAEESKDIVNLSFNLIDEQLFGDNEGSQEFV